MSHHPAIAVEHVSKKYSKSLKRSMLYGLADLCRDACQLPRRTDRLRPAEFWALQDVGFELHRGEWLGVIGANGAGKSTLLKLLGGILPPDSGRIVIRGEVSALIELGAGFHPLLTGRENIHLQGAVMGMTRREIEVRFDDIVEFAGMRDFLDMPVKFYSSGMHARLGFAIPVHCDPDILLIDEVLAVGDMAFQEKCMRRMERMRAADKAVLMVSHSLYRIESLCDRALWLDRGRVVALGPAKDVVRAYLDDQDRRYRDAIRRELVAGSLDPDLAVDISSVELVGDDNNAKQVFAVGERMTVRIRFNARERVEWPLFNIRIVHAGHDIIEATMQIDGPIVEYIDGPGVVECRLDRLPLTPKVYEVVAWVRSKEGIMDVAPMRTYAVFQVGEQNIEQWPMRGPMALNHLRQGSPVYVRRSWHFFSETLGESASEAASTEPPAMLAR